jgi:hypothetical protein
VGLFLQTERSQQENARALALGFQEEGMAFFVAGETKQGKRLGVAHGSPYWNTTLEHDA